MITLTIMDSSFPFPSLRSLSICEVSRTHERETLSLASAIALIASPPAVLLHADCAWVRAAQSGFQDAQGLFHPGVGRTNPAPRIEKKRQIIHCDCQIRMGAA